MAAGPCQRRLCLLRQAVRIVANLSPYGRPYREGNEAALTVLLVVIAIVLISAIGVQWFLMRSSAPEPGSLRNRLNAMATTDPLTGLFDRGHMLMRPGSPSGIDRS